MMLGDTKTGLRGPEIEWPACALTLPQTSSWEATMRSGPWKPHIAKFLHFMCCALCGRDMLGVSDRCSGSLCRSGSPLSLRSWCWQISHEASQETLIWNLTRCSNSRESISPSPSSSNSHKSTSVSSSVSRLPMTVVIAARNSSRSRLPLPSLSNLVYTAAISCESLSGGTSTNCSATRGRTGMRCPTQR